MVKIVADTLSCLSSEISTRYHIPIIPQVIHFGDESYLEGIDLDADAFLQKLRASKELPKTAAPPVELFINIFEDLLPSTKRL